MSHIPGAVRVPRIDLSDKLLLGLTGRQLAYAAAGLVSAWLAWRGLSAFSPVLGAVVAVPLLLVAAALVFGQRDGAGLDRLLLAAVRMPRRPLVAATAVTAAPAWVNAAEDAPVLPRLLRSPARGVRADGVIDLGPDGLVAVIEVAALVNFALRSPGEQDALVAGLARGLHALGGPIQILSTSFPADLGGQAAVIEEAAATLATPRLREAALAHAGYLRRLSDRVLLVRRRVLVAVAAGDTAGLDRRVAEVAAVIGGCGLPTARLSALDVLLLLDALTDPCRDLRME
ncbi:hypothetical protein Afil01_31410 [Actinorhabdospora filicis]|uniref:PrgI family protein n=1 Tax=Actinorhabdospora filicis TaxID=1785913 RepID=A0A9W6W990_9ACTN|nr:PrgI family protein [Actinorhabdospora filicis]GLZ78334.1 hypothetical protein Afil01_31410 [Actinorhabdospora filicis]